MKIKFVYSILPAFVFYEEVDGDIKNYARGWKVVIQPKYEGDHGILQHELTHVKQWYRGGFFIATIRYNENRKYRLSSEVEAYAAQMRYPDRNGHYLTVDEAADKLLWDRYDLRITREQAVYYLQKALK